MRGISALLLQASRIDAPRWRRLLGGAGMPCMRRPAPLTLHPVDPGQLIWQDRIVAVQNNDVVAEPAHRGGPQRVAGGGQADSAGSRGGGGSEAVGGEAAAAGAASQAPRHAASQPRAHLSPTSAACCAMAAQSSLGRSRRPGPLLLLRKAMARAVDGAGRSGRGGWCGRCGTRPAAARPPLKWAADRRWAHRVAAERGVAGGSMHSPNDASAPAFG